MTESHTVVISGYDIEGELAFEFGEGLLLGATASSERPHGLRSEGEIGRHRGVFEVTVVGREEIELVVLGARMMHPLAVDHDPQLKSPDCQHKLRFETVEISRNGGPARLGGDQGFDSGPVGERDLDRIEAAQTGEQFEQFLLKKG